MLGVVSFAEEQVPEAKFSGLNFQFLDDGYHDLPPCRRVGWNLCMCQCLGREDLILKPENEY